MGLLNKKEDEETPEEELLDEDAASEFDEDPAEEEQATEAEAVSPAMAEARDAARVCVLINRAIQEASAFADGTLPQGEELDELKGAAARHAARAAGIWQALDNDCLPAQAEAAQALNVIADEERLAQLSAHVIVDARESLQDLLGRVDVGGSGEEG